MKKESPRLPLLSIAIVCFVVGTLSVQINLSNQGDQAEPAISIEAPSTTSQKTALIIGVDDLKRTEPRLLATWLASFQFPSKEIILSGFPTDYQPTGFSTPLAGLFRWFPDAGVDKTFLEAIQQTKGKSIDVVLVLDEIGYASLIDFMDGVTLAGNFMDGPTVISALRVFYEDPLISLDAQSKILRALAARVGTLGEAPNLTPLFDL